MLTSADINILLCMLPFIAASAWMWWKTVGTTEPPFWKVPRAAPLPLQSPGLFLAGGLLLIGKIMLIIRLKTKFVDPAFGDQKGYDPARMIATYQLIAGVSLLMILAAAGVVFSRSAEQRRSLGFHLENLKQQIGFGIHGFLLAIIPVYLLVFAVWKLNLKEEPESVHDLLRLVADGYVFWPILAAVLIAPIQEELVYRVLLQEGLVAAGYPIRLALPGVALFFSLNHLFPDMIPLFPLALLFGATYHYRNSFLASVVMHMLFNGFNIGLMLLGGHV